MLLKLVLCLFVALLTVLTSQATAITTTPLISQEYPLNSSSAPSNHYGHESALRHHHAPSAPHLRYRSEFTAFVRKYLKSYSPLEFYKRFNLFQERLDFINGFNAQSTSFQLGVNQHSDRTREELNEILYGLKPTAAAPLQGHDDSEKVKIDAFKQPTLTAAERSAFYVNWIDKGFVGPIRDQDKCASDYAFAATTTLASRYAIAKKEPLVHDLAPQQLLECSKSYGNAGCAGGTVTASFDYFAKGKMGGACGEIEYPYFGPILSSFAPLAGFCHLCLPLISNLKSYQPVSPGPDALIMALQGGPVAVALDANLDEFVFYKSGVFDVCAPPKGTNLSHAAVLVGFMNKDGQDVFVLRNSWGGDWGHKGTVYLPIVQNCLGLEQEAARGLNVYPVFH